MMIPGQNTLPLPAIVETPPFETLLESFKSRVVAAIAATDAETAAQVETTLANEAEIMTKVIEAAVVVLQTERRYNNEQIQQMLAWLSEGTNLDAKVADLGIERQVIDEGDPDAYPVVEPTMESDADLRRRWFLAPYSFSTAGPQLAYRYHALTLDARPQISVDAPEAGTVVVTYTLPSDSAAGQIKDGVGVRTGPGAVRVAILAHEGDGTPSSDLLASVASYFARDDVAPGTDDITVTAAEIQEWRCQAVVYINRGPDGDVVESAAITGIQDYADEQHRLGGAIETTMIDSVLHNAGAVRIDLTAPAVPLRCGDFQAPYCTGIDIEVQRI